MRQKEFVAWECSTRTATLSPPSPPEKKLAPMGNSESSSNNNQNNTDAFRNKFVRAIFDMRTGGCAEFEFVCDVSDVGAAQAIVDEAELSGLPISVSTEPENGASSLRVVITRDTGDTEIRVDTFTAMYCRLYPNVAARKVAEAGRQLQLVPGICMTGSLIGDT